MERLCKFVLALESVEIPEITLTRSPVDPIIAPAPIQNALNSKCLNQGLGQLAWADQTNATKGCPTHQTLANMQIFGQEYTRALYLS